MKGLIKEYPKNKVEMYIYNPVNLMSATYKYSIAEYRNLAYYNRRIDAGLCYYDLESVEKRINEELERLEKEKLK